MNTDYTLINIKSIPAVFPVAQFRDQKITYNRPIQQPDSYTEKFWSKPYKTIDGQKTRRLLVQSVLRNKYKIEVEIKEQTNIHLVDVAGVVEFALYNGMTIDAYIISMSYEQVEDTQNWVVTIEFCVLCEDFKQVNNYHEKTHIRERYGDNQLNKVYAYTNHYINEEWLNVFEQGYTFYSDIEIQMSSSEMVEQLNEEKGKTFVNNSIDFDIANIQLYLNNADFRVANRYLRRCEFVCVNPLESTDTLNVWEGTKNVTFASPKTDRSGWIFVGGQWNEIVSNTDSTNSILRYNSNVTATNQPYLHTTENAIERIVPEVEETEMINLHDVKLKLKFNEINFNNY